MVTNSPGQISESYIPPEDANDRPCTSNVPAMTKATAFGVSVFVEDGESVPQQYTSEVMGHCFQPDMMTTRRFAAAFCDLQVLVMYQKQVQRVSEALPEIRGRCHLAYIPTVANMKGFNTRGMVFFNFTTLPLVDCEKLRESVASTAVHELAHYGHMCHNSDFATAVYDILYKRHSIIQSYITG